MPRKRVPRAVEYEPNLIGYARVSTLEQNLDMQIQALMRAGVHPDAINVEKVSAVDDQRPGLDWAIDSLRPGDVLVVWKLDRIARNMRHLFKCIDRIEALGASFRSITESVRKWVRQEGLTIREAAKRVKKEFGLKISHTTAGMYARKVGKTKR